MRQESAAQIMQLLCTPQLPLYTLNVSMLSRGFLLALDKEFNIDSRVHKYGQPLEELQDGGDLVALLALLQFEAGHEQVNNYYISHFLSQSSRRAFLVSTIAYP